MSELAYANQAVTIHVSREGWDNTRAHRFVVGVVADGTDEGYSALVLNLPQGVGGSGDTEEEALESAREAILGVLDEYKASGEDIPWVDVVCPRNAKRKVVVVNA